jgi:serine/threonine protein phosphatase PrpC
MACVLTLAVVDEDSVTVGHVGDSRLYLAWNGTLRKITSDHSPVGELEDQGHLSETEAMAHPRRHEVFREIGSQWRDENTPDFIELKSFRLFPSAALLLCTDGLTDAVPASDIAAIIDTYNGDPEAIVRRLIKAANDRGGADNVSAVFVAGPEFIGAHAPSLVAVRSRHAITRMRRSRQWRRNFSRLVWLIIGMVLGASIWPVTERIAHWTWGR